MEAEAPISISVDVYCLRLDQPRSPEEHLACAYCHGGADGVATGDRKRFCDFQRGQDPVDFGFPEGSTRDREG